MIVGIFLSSNNNGNYIFKTVKAGFSLLMKPYLYMSKTSRQKIKYF